MKEDYQMMVSKTQDLSKYLKSMYTVKRNGALKYDESYDPIKSLVELIEIKQTLIGKWDKFSSSEKTSLFELVNLTDEVVRDLTQARWLSRTSYK